METSLSRRDLNVRMFRHEFVRPLLEEAEAVLVRSRQRTSGRFGPRIESAVIALGTRIADADDCEETVPRFIELTIPIIAQNADEEQALREHLTAAWQVDKFFVQIGDDELHGLNEKNVPVSPPVDARGEASPNGPPISSPGSSAGSAAPKSAAPEQSASFAFTSILEVIRDTFTYIARLLRLHGRYARLVRQRISDGASQLSLIVADAAARSQDVALDRKRVIAFPRSEFAERFRLDTDRTIAATVASAGLFSPRWKRNIRSVEYLVLIQGFGPHDLEESRVDRAFDRLAAAGLPLARYYYRSDPRYVHDRSHTERAVDLATLLDRHPTSRLVVVSAGRELIHPFTLLPMNWTSILAAWPRRALLTSLPRGSWSRTETILRDELGFSIAPSDEEGIANLARVLASDEPELSQVGELGPRPPPILQDNETAFVSDFAPADDEQQALIVQLRAYLGETGFRLLAACSFYPEVRLDLVLYLDRLLNEFEERAEENREDVLARLACLCWFRQGHLPAWFRRRIRASLQRHDLRALRRRMGQLFSGASLLEPGHMQPGGSETPDGVALPIYSIAGAELQGTKIDAVTLESLLDGPTRDLDPLLRLPEQNASPQAPPDRVATESSGLAAEEAPPIAPDATAPETPPVDQEPRRPTSAAQEMPWSGSGGGLIFISHSAQNNVEAVALRNWLSTEGWNEVFLDLDPERGIAAGERWQQALRQAAARSEAVIFLISRAWLESAWMRAELELAHRLNKLLIGVVIEAIPIKELPDSLAADSQIVDLASGYDQTTFRVDLPGSREEVQVSFSVAGLTRLKAGLQRAGLDPRFFPWPPGSDPNRAPYRGLRPLEEEDAGIFFGREGLIVEALDRLRGLRERVPPRLLVLLGAAGVGKSSLLRAGILPRLARDGRHFVSLPVIRPERAAITGPTGLVSALYSALLEIGPAHARGAVHDAVSAGAGGVRRVLQRIVDDPARRILSEEAGRQRPTVVIAIDQAEELFLSDGGEEAAAVLNLLRDLLYGDEPSVIALMTMRSDAYGLLQSAPALGGVRAELMSVPPMAIGSYQAVIQGPAERAGAGSRPIRIDPALTDSLLADVEAAGGSALPLLAFTLERLYQEYGAGKRLTLADYQALGGLRGSIEASLTRALAGADSDPRIPREREARLALLRRGMIPWLVSVDPATGNARRRVARLSEIPLEARPMLERLVDARLLITDTSPEGDVIIEAAHEALLQEWELVRRWLNEDRQALITLHGVQQAARDWEANGRRADWLVHFGSRLEDAVAVAARSDLAGGLGRLERDYLMACRKRDRWRGLRSLFGR